MNDIQTIVNSIQDIEMKEKVNEVYEAIEVLSQRQPVTGFHHRFYVPGWIGSIQWFMVISKMDKWGNQPFYKDKNYYAFAEWIGELAKTFHDYLHSPDIKSREDFEEHSNDIISSLYLLLSAWVECSPEVATINNKEYRDEETEQDYDVSLVFLLQKQLEHELGKPTQAKETKIETSVWSDFKESAKSYGYLFAGWLINILLVAVIACLFDLIFD